MTMHLPGYTFACEKLSEEYWLCVVDVHGVSRKIAQFPGPACMALFKRTLNLAKMASHEHGRSGI